MQPPHVFVVRAQGEGFVVHALDSEMIQYYTKERDAIRHALFLLRWLGHTGEPFYTRKADGTLHVSFAQSVQSRWDLV